MSEKGLSSNADLICCGCENKYFLPWNLSTRSVSCHSYLEIFQQGLSAATLLCQWQSWPDLKQTQNEVKEIYNYYCINYSDVTMQMQCRLAAECNPMW